MQMRPIQVATDEVIAIRETYLVVIDFIRSQKRYCRYLLDIINGK